MTTLSNYLDPMAKGKSSSGNGKGGKGSKPSKGPGRPPGRKPTYTVYARVSPRLGRAFKDLLKKTRRSKTAEVELALEAWLKDNGLWPPPEKEDGP